MNGDMTCGRARRLFWPDGGPKPVSPEVIDAQEHLATCPACQRFLTETRSVAEAIRASAPREEAPAEVRERLFAALAHARAGVQPRGRRHAGYWLLASAAALVVILGAALLHSRLTRDAPADIIAELTAEHARAVGEAHIASSDHAGVATWLARHVHFGAQVPVLPGATLRGARISVFDGRPSAVLEYDVAGTAMSYFMIPNERGSADASSAVRFDQTARAGYRVISWREPGLLHAMVGNLSPPQLLALAKACVEQARRGVA